MRSYRERKQVPLLPRPGDDSFVADVTTLFYSFIGVALKNRVKESIAFARAICCTHSRAVANKYNCIINMQ